MTVCCLCAVAGQGGDGARQLAIALAARRLGEAAQPRLPRRHVAEIENLVKLVVSHVSVLRHLERERKEYVIFTVRLIHSDLCGDASGVGLAGPVAELRGDEAADPGHPLYFPRQQDAPANLASLVLICSNRTRQPSSTEN